MKGRANRLGACGREVVEHLREPFSCMATVVVQPVEIVRCLPKDAGVSNPVHSTNRSVWKETDLAWIE